MTFGAIHHFEINVSNLDSSVNFWGWLLDLLGYKAHQSWPKGRSWILGDTYFVIVQTELTHLDQKYHRKKTGLNHVAFHVNSYDDVINFSQLIAEKGYNILYKDKHPFAGGENYCAVYFEDPDGIKVELVAKQPN